MHWLQTFFISLLSDFYAAVGVGYEDGWTEFGEEANFDDAWDF